MNFGIPDKSFHMILEVLKEYEEVEKALIFGSRAMGNYKNGSDIDLAICGSQVTEDIVNKIRVKLNEELPIPYYFDIIHYEALQYKELKEHIDTFGKVFYVRHEAGEGD